MKLDKMIKTLSVFFILISCVGCSKTNDIQKYVNTIKASDCHNIAIDSAMTLRTLLNNKDEQVFSIESTNNLLSNKDYSTLYEYQQYSIKYDNEPYFDYDSEKITILDDDSGFNTFLYEFGSWSKNEEHLGMDLFDLYNLFPNDINMIELVDDNMIFEDKETICLKSKVTGDNLVDLINMSCKYLYTYFSDCDYSKLICEEKIYLDKKTKLPIACEMDIYGANDFFSNYFSIQNIDIIGSHYSIVIHFDDYGKDGNIHLTQDVNEHLEMWKRLLDGYQYNGDGTYTIFKYLIMIDIKPPSNFILKGSYSDILAFNKNNETDITYSLDYFIDDGAMKEYVDMIVSGYKSKNIDCSTEEYQKQIGDFNWNIYLIDLNDYSFEKEYYAWCVPDDYMMNSYSHLIVKAKGNNFSINDFESYLEAVSNKKY